MRTFPYPGPNTRSKGKQKREGNEHEHFLAAPIKSRCLLGIVFSWLVINIPVIGIILISLLIGAAIDPQAWWLALSIGFILGWTWWSHSVPRWRRWAQQRGANPDSLQKWAVITGLVWRKGSRLEKTEAKLKD